ncbi:uncharacterized protein LOC141613187 [Silene latifolia]|uniref:uncharacterized protein LOC141613187 n=1 Tax=Silene latifolia TaxID=37657 RepID=UPI003D772EE3
MLTQFLSDIDVVPSAYNKQSTSCNKSTTPLRRSLRGHIHPKNSQSKDKSLQFPYAEPTPLQITFPKSTHVSTSVELSKLNVRRRLETVTVEETEEVDEDFSSSSETSDVEKHFEDIEDDRVIETQVSPTTIDHTFKTNGLFRVDNLVVRLENESDGDSEELRSLQGSDVEVEIDPNPIFNLEVDFKKEIVLKLGLKFPTVVDLRLALKQYAIENGDDFFYLHNGRKKLSAYCVNKCDYEWDNVRSKVKACTCNNPDKCLFRVCAAITHSEDAIQIKGMGLEHSCAFSTYTRQVTSEFLAAKYLEDWRIRPSWKLKEFKAQVYKDLLVEVGYSKLWRARDRAKLLIHGNASDEYKIVYDYAQVIEKYNPGSSTHVLCETMHKHIPVFQRMYMCLEACKQEFVRGCRLIIGVDGSHLKGPYPGMCLVAVGKDGNNNIFPIAWAVVEVENTQTWRWFFVLLLNDVGRSNEEGKGLTFMSDMQKGLLEAFSTITPKAGIRFCVRHIWANFKLHFTGMAFKENFWKAAKSTNKNDFLSHLEAIKALKPEAHAYLVAIPPESWSRHAFTYTAKSDMLLNNMCETFNSVLKEARDKPILTQMEWMRRYIMLRNCERRQGIIKYKGVNMPFVYKFFEWAHDQARFCKCFGAIVDKWEVEYMSDRHDINLKERTCSCNHWQLTGIPCLHAYACILK